MLSLPALMLLHIAEFSGPGWLLRKGGIVRPASKRLIGSIRTTVAPKSARIRVAAGAGDRRC